MISGVNSAADPAGRLGVATRDVAIRLLNCSPSGCLLETDARLECGAMGVLRVTIDGNEFIDDVEVVRCQPIQGAGALYQIGVRFLWNAPLNRRALRRLAWQWSQGDMSES